MCISFVYCNDDGPADGYKLIMASNRDESYVREARSLYRWPDSEVIGGQDAVKAGTWLGATATGKIGILLNVLGENSHPNGKDRGPIVVDFLQGDLGAEDYLRELKTKTEQNVYNGFHNVLVELTTKGSNIFHFCNISPFDSPSTKVTRVTDNPHKDHVYGFGNSQCVSKPFQKVVAGKRKFAEIVALHNRKLNTSHLLDSILLLMKNKDRNYPDPEIDRKAVAYMDEDYKIKYSGICVEMPSLLYGTRTHSIILVDHENTMDFHEWTLENHETLEWKHTHIRQKLSLA